MRCRGCRTPLDYLFVDLGVQAFANRFLDRDDLSHPEVCVPLRVYVCARCLLVQVADYHIAADVFTSDYVYFSSYVPSWVEHARRYVDMACDRFGLGPRSFVVEIASNDGYLLQHAVARGIPCLGIDPAAAAAAAAREKGVKTVVGFFGKDMARRIVADHGGADLVIANNVFAHVSDPNDFAAGLALLMKPGGALTLEFPHVARLIELTQFDTIYHEHFSYFSFYSARRILESYGLAVFDVEELPTHGGSLRLYAGVAGGRDRSPSPAVAALILRERALGLDRLEGYGGFSAKVEASRVEFLAFMHETKFASKKIAAFGAAAKGNTFLNYCAIDANDIDYVVDDTPAKKGKFLPQSHIPVVAEARIRETRPDFVLILPWNVKDEVMRKLAYVREWSGRFVTCIPRLEIS